MTSVTSNLPLSDELCSDLIVQMYFLFCLRISTRQSVNRLAVSRRELLSARLTPVDNSWLLRTHCSHFATTPTVDYLPRTDYWLLSCQLLYSWSNLPNTVSFSQGSVATRLGCGEIFNDHFIASFQEIVIVKALRKSDSIRPILMKLCLEYRRLFFPDTVYKWRLCISYMPAAVTLAVKFARWRHYVKWSY